MVLQIMPPLHTGTQNNKMSTKIKIALIIIGIFLLLKIIPKKPPNRELFYKYWCYHDITYYTLKTATSCGTKPFKGSVAVSRELGYKCGDKLYIGHPINKVLTVNDVTSIDTKNTIDIWYQSENKVPSELKHYGRLNLKVLFN